MSYSPTNWQAGDTVTSAKLNKIEQGIKNNILITNIIVEDPVAYLDKTWQEIYDADFCIANTTSEGEIRTSFVGIKSPANEEQHRSNYEVILFSPGLTEY